MCLAQGQQRSDAGEARSITNVTILGVFRTHAQKEYGKVLKMKSTYILNILALLFFLKLAMHLLKVWSKRHPV